jgi:hypothetical protein
VIMRMEELGKLKSASSDTRTGNLPAPSIVPQETTQYWNSVLDYVCEHSNFALLVYSSLVGCDTM